MRKIFLFLFLVVASTTFSQTEGTQLFQIKAVTTPSISNCGNIVNDGIIESTYHSNATLYHFKLTNINTSSTLTLTSTTNQIALSAFWSIITYNSSYKVSVMYEYLDHGDTLFSRWSRVCEFSLGKPPRLQLEGVECNQQIRLEEPIYCTEILNATCYTFYITNLTTGQSTNTGCLPQNFVLLNALPISISIGDVIEISVSYNIGEQVKETTRRCRFTIGRPKKLCYTVDITDETWGTNISTPTMKTAYDINVGSLWVIHYQDAGTFGNYASAPWTGENPQMVAVLSDVLLDLEDFLIRNDLDPNCGHSSQRFGVYLVPYLQDWVTNGWFTDAYAVAGQQIMGETSNQTNPGFWDVNWLSQGCSEVPNVQLGLIHGNYGNNSILDVGGIFVNPVQDNISPTFNYNTTAPAYTFGTLPDLYSIFLHEMLHILGINWTDFKFQNLVYNNGIPLTDTDLTNCTNHPNFSTLSTDGCDNVYFHPVDQEALYAPSVFTVGSLSHFVDFCGSSLFGDNVMHPDLIPGETKRCLHQREVNALRHIGYNLNSDSGFGQCPSPYNPAQNPDYIIGNHDGLIVESDPYGGYNCDYHVYTPITNAICDTWPLVIHPLDNDINATFIDEAVMRTGEATSSLTFTGTEILFTADVPGVYTIEYVPANPDREGLPTYIQIWVPSCSDSDLDLVTCDNGTTNCNQICFDGSINEHVVNRGIGLTTPYGFTGPENQFEFSASYNNFTNEPVYSSIFFWVDTDVFKDYSVYLERRFWDMPWAGSSSPDPEVEMRMFLVKSQDMIGQINQTANNFVLPTNHQEIYYEKFVSPYNNTGGYEPISICFTSLDEYDMLVFVPKTSANGNYNWKGKFDVQNLEFMEKAFPNLPDKMQACIPDVLELGEEFCATQGNSFTWTSALNNVTLSTNQIYSPGIISSPIFDQFVFSMIYTDPLPAATQFPTDNSTCNQSYAVSVTYDDCCTDGSIPQYHPLKPESTSRTMGEDVDADQNGALYYSGEFPVDVEFGLLSLINGGPVSGGFVVKFLDNCTEWLIATDYRNSRLDVSDAGKIYYSGTEDLLGVSDTYFAELNPADGSEIWNWLTHITGSGIPYITDFKINEVNGEIIIVGYATANFQYDANLIATTPNDVFIIRTDAAGNLIEKNIIPTGVSSPKAKVSVENSNLYISFQSTSTEWLLQEHNYTTLVATGVSRQLTSSTANWQIKAMDMDAGIISIQAVSASDIVDVTGGSVNLLSFAGSSTGFVTFNPLLIPQLNVVNGQIAVGSVHILDQDMDMYNGEILISYVDPAGILQVSSYNAVLGNLLWQQTTTPNSSWIGNQGVKGTPLGTFNTGAFVEDIIIDATSFVLHANQSGQVTTFYGIKYDVNGDPVPFIVPFTGAQSDNSDAFETLTTDPLNSISKVKIYPNPGKGLFTLETEGEHEAIVLDLNGQQVLTFSGSNISKFDLSGFADGLYVLKIQANNKISIVKLVKE